MLNKRLNEYTDEAKNKNDNRYNNGDFIAVTYVLFPDRRNGSRDVGDYYDRGIYIPSCAELFVAKNLFKGKYTKSRIIYTVTDFALLIIMLALPISGIAMSKHILVSVHFGISAAAARRIHILAAYWGFVLMSFHAGLHIRNLLAERVSRTAQIIFTVICAYGLFAFIKRDVAGYLLMRNDFAFFDFNEPAVYFILDHAAIMCLFAGIGCCITKFLKQKSG